MDPTRRSREHLRCSRPAVRGGRRAGTGQIKIGSETGLPRRIRWRSPRRCGILPSRRPHTEPGRHRDDAVLDHRHGTHGCRNRLCGRSSGGRPARRCLARLPRRARLWTSYALRCARDDLRRRTRRCRVRLVGTLFEDTVNNRLLCGEGSFDLTGLVALLRDLGFDGPWGVEILSTSFRALPVAQAAQARREVGAGGALISQAP